MDLWILSQDKHSICKATFLKIGKNCFSEWCVFDNNNELGGYATEERTLEVLGEIQKLLIGDILCFKNVKPPKFEDLMAIGVNNAFVFNTQKDEREQVEFLHRDCVVFEMPEK